MATVLDLAMKVSADASGVQKPLTQAERALANLGKQADATLQSLSKFASGSSAAASAQAQFADQFGKLAQSLQSGAIRPDEYASQYATLQASVKEASAAFAEGASVTAQYATAQEKQSATMQRLDALYQAQAISLETYNRASADVLGINEEAARSEQERAQAMARAAQITQANLTPQQRYDQEVQELAGHLEAGRISQDTFNAAVAKATASFAKAESAAKGYDRAVGSAGDGGILKFNELSGIFSALPGPIGNVAGRLSGLASAGEGLGRIFSGGITQGISSLGASVAGLINPFTAALAGVTAFAAGATAVARGLVELEDRVEKLGNLADQLGVSFEFVQVLEEAASRSGVSVEMLTSSMSRLQKTLAGADAESKTAQAALSKLGISIQEINGLSQQDQIRLIGERLAGITDPAQRTAAAMELFGKSGAALLPFFKNLGPAATDIERLGGALSDIDRGRIDDFGAGLDALGVASSRLGELLLLPFVGLGEGIAQGAAEFLGGINAIVGPVGNVLEPVLSGLGQVVEVAGVILGGIGRQLGAILSPIGELAQAFAFVGDSINSAFVDAVRYLVDASVATTEWIVSFSALGLIADNIGAIGETVGRIANIIGTAFSQVGSYIGNLVSQFAEFIGLQGAIESIGGVISSVFGGVSQTFQTIASAIGGTVGRLLTIAENFLGIKNEVETPIEATLDLSQPMLAATQFSDEIGSASKAAAEFGDAGFQAALRYQTSLEQIAQLQADDTLSSEEAKTAAKQARDEFDKTIVSLDREAEAQKKAADEAKKAADDKIAAAERAANAQIEADRRRTDSFMQSQGLGGEDARTRAAEDLAAVTRQIEETEAAIAEARARGDKSAEAAAIKRLQTLDQAQAAAQQRVEIGFSTQDANKAIEDVRNNLDSAFTFDNFQIAPEAFSDAQDQLSQLEQQLLAGAIDPQTFEMAADAIRSGFEDALETAQKIADLNEQYAERAAAIEKERLDALGKAGPRTIEINDVRTQQGASQYLQMATGQQDPAVEEYKKQLSELKKISSEIRNLGGTVEIVGAA